MDTTEACPHHYDSQSDDHQYVSAFRIVHSIVLLTVICSSTYMKVTLSARNVVLYMINK